jgi:hypothetical protein
MMDLGKALIVLGALLLAAGVLFLVLGRIPGIGRLPGDIVIRRDNFVFIFPLTTCLIVSVVVSFLLYLFRR